MQPAADAGAVVADSIPVPVAGNVAVVIMVNVVRHVCEVVLGPDGVLATGRPRLLVIDSTTIHPVTSQRLAARLGAERIDCLDAPVMSNSEDARRAELWFQVGGDQRAYACAIPLFEAMGNRHVHLGFSSAVRG